MKKILLAGVAMFAAISAASAADMPTKAPVMVAPYYNWTGLYVGGQLGGGWGDHDRLTTTGVANSYDSSGFIGGAFIGYNWQMGGFVLGAEADINGASIKGDDAGFGGTLDQSRLTWVGSLRGRAGFAVNNWLFFGTAGYAFGDIRHTNAGGVPVSNTQSVDGFTAGAGAEWGFARNWTARVEYRYYDLGKYNLAPTGLVPFSVDNTFSTVTAGLAYRF